MIALTERQVIARGSDPEGRELVVLRGLSVSLRDELHVLGEAAVEDWLKTTCIRYLRMVDFLGETQSMVMIANFARPDSERLITLVGWWSDSNAPKARFIVDLLDVDEVQPYLDQQGLSLP